LYDLPRKENERYINDYCPKILIVWDGNMDIQYCKEETGTLTSYVSKYLVKTEGSIYNFNPINSTKSVASNFWSMATRATSHRECGILEAVDLLLGYSIYASDPDTQIRWLDTRIVRNKKVKTIQEIQQLSPDSEEIFCKNLIDDYYPSRPEELENISLYEFAKNFDIIDKKPIYKAVFYQLMHSNKFCKQRKTPYLINHWKY